MEGLPGSQAKVQQRNFVKVLVDNQRLLLLPEIVATVSGGRLTIRFKDDQGRTQYWPSQPIRCTVTAVDVRGLEVAGGGNLDAGPIETDDLQINTSGGSQADLAAVVADTMRVEVSGGVRTHWS